MDLNTCPSCKKIIVNKTGECSECGYRFTSVERGKIENQRRSGFKIFKVVVVIAIPLLVMAIFETMLKTKEPPLPSDNIAMLIEKLQTSDDSIRDRTILEIAKRGSAAKEALPVLMKLFKDRNPRIRVRAIEAVRGIGPEARDAVPALVIALKDPDASVRGNAASTLRTIGPVDIKDVVPSLIEALKDKDISVQNNAAHALAVMGPAAKEAVPTLIEALDYLPAAATALGGIGPAAESAIPALITAFKKTSGEDGAGFPEIFSKIGPASVPALIEIFKDNNYSTQRWAAYAFMEIGPSAKDAVPTLIETLKKTNSIIKQNPTQTPTEITGLDDAVCDALWRIDPAASEGISESLDCFQVMGD